MKSLFFDKNHKKRHIWKTARFWAVLFGDKIRSPIGMQNSQLSRVPRQRFTTEMRTSSFVKFFISVFWKKFKKNVISRKLQEFEQP